MAIDPGLFTGAIITIIGTVLGAIMTFGVTYYTSILAEKQEKNKVKKELEIKALEEIYSPLTFLIDKTRNVYVSIIALQSTINEINVDTSEKTTNEFNAIHVLMVSEIDKYRIEYEKNLKNKLYLIDSKEFYRDLFLFIGYLDTLNTLFMQVKINDKIGEALNSFRPLINILDGATSNLREYAIAKTAHNVDYNYKLFFTDELYKNAEKEIDNISIQVSGSKVIPWEKVINEKINILPP